MESFYNYCGNDMELVRYNKKWYKVQKKPYEPERQTFQVAWLQLVKQLSAADAYRENFERQREDAKILYPSFRKDKDDS